MCVECNIYIIFCVHFWLELFGVEFKLVGDEDRGANAKHIDKHTDTLADRTGGGVRKILDRTTLIGGLHKWLGFGVWGGSWFECSSNTMQRLNAWTSTHYVCYTCTSRQ